MSVNRTPPLLHSKVSGNGPVIVLIHGMAASLRYWDALAAELEADHTVIRLDLLGFGRSPMPSSVTYDYSTQIDSITYTLSTLGIKKSTPITLVGHSMGALIAAHMASSNELAVKRLILIGPPIYASAADAKRAITKASRLWELVYFGPTSNMLCNVWCRTLRPVSRYIAPLYLKHVPRTVAEDSLLHTWQSYAESLENIILRQHLFKDLAAANTKTDVIIGTTDPSNTKENKQKLSAHPKTTVYIEEGSHQILHENMQSVLEVIAQ